jgi:hypothetical protein
VGQSDPSGSRDGEDLSDTARPSNRRAGDRRRRAPPALPPLRCIRRPRRRRGKQRGDLERKSSDRIRRPTQPQPTYHELTICSLSCNYCWGYFAPSPSSTFPVVSPFCKVRRNKRDLLLAGVSEVNRQSKNLHLKPIHGQSIAGYL